MTSGGFSRSMRIVGSIQAVVREDSMFHLSMSIWVGFSVGVRCEIGFTFWMHFMKKFWAIYLLRFFWRYFVTLFWFRIRRFSFFLSNFLIVEEVSFLAEFKCSFERLSVFILDLLVLELFWSFSFSILYFEISFLLDERYLTAELFLLHIVQTLVA